MHVVINRRSALEGVTVFTDYAEGDIVRNSTGITLRIASINDNPSWREDGEAWAETVDAYDPDPPEEPFEWNDIDSPESVTLVARGPVKIADLPTPTAADIAHSIDPKALIDPGALPDDVDVIYRPNALRAVTGSYTDGSHLDIDGIAANGMPIRFLLTISNVEALDESRPHPVRVPRPMSPEAAFEYGRQLGEEIAAAKAAGRTGRELAKVLGSASLDEARFMRIMGISERAVRDAVLGDPDADLVSFALRWVRSRYGVPAAREMEAAFPEQAFDLQLDEHINIRRVIYVGEDAETDDQPDAGRRTEQ